MIESSRPGVAVAGCYVGTAPNPTFDDVLAACDPIDDERLADLIEADGRLRLEMGLSLDLGRYLGTIDDLSRRPVALDAAIDMALRARQRHGEEIDVAIRSLIGEFPEFSNSIHEAAALGSALWSTVGLRRHMETAAARPLPCGFGTRLDDGEHRYVLRELLGVGAFGQVYAAVDRLLSEQEHDALVSIKVLAGTGRSEEARRHLIDEAAKARRVDHPNVVRVLDRGVSDRDEDYIVHEYVDGGNLEAWTQLQRPLTPRVAADLMRKVASGVHAAHMAGLVHCDIKPANIVMTSDGEPKVADFGIAIRAGQPVPQGDVMDEPLGNLAFMSPEQYRRELGALTIPSDLYALGGVLFWMLTERHPNGESCETIRMAHLSESPQRTPALSTFRKEVDRDLDAVCHRALSPAPADRQSSAAVFADDLQAWLERRPLEWNHPSPGRRGVLWVKRRPRSAAMLAAMIWLIVATGVLVSYFSGVARQERLDKLMEEQRRELEADSRVRYQAELKGFVSNLFFNFQLTGQSHKLLEQIWWVEWLYGPTVLGEGSDKIELWNLRKDAIRDLITESRAEGDSPGLQTCLWEFALAFWLVKDGDHLEATPLIDVNRGNWETLLAAEDDPMLRDLDALATCALVNRYRDTPGTDIDMKVTLKSLQEAARELETRQPGSPMHRLVLESGKKLSASSLLDYAAGAFWFDRHLKIIDAETELKAGSPQPSPPRP